MDHLNHKNQDMSGQSMNATGVEGRSKRRLTDFFISNKLTIDYKDVDVLRKFLSPEGKILPGRRTGLTSSNQRKLTKAIKRARQLALLPYVGNEF